MSTPLQEKFAQEFEAHCPSCLRKVGVMSTNQGPGLRYSRHLKGPGQDGFCPSTCAEFDSKVAEKIEKSFKKLVTDLRTGKDRKR